MSLDGTPGKAKKKTRTRSAHLATGAPTSPTSLLRLARKRERRERAQSKEGREPEAFQEQDEPKRRKSIKGSIPKLELQALATRDLHADERDDSTAAKANKPKLQGLATRDLYFNAKERVDPTATSYREEMGSATKRAQRTPLALGSHDSDDANNESENMNEMSESDGSEGLDETHRHSETLNGTEAAAALSQRQEITALKEEIERLKLQLTQGNPNTNATHALSLPAAIKDKSALPAPISLGTGAVTTEQFISWKGKVVAAVNTVARMRPILNLEPEEAWKEFQRINPGYDSTTLEQQFVHASLGLWYFITSGLEDKIRHEITETVKSNPKHNLTNRLNFSFPDHEFYQDCRGAMTLIEEKFMPATHWRFCQYMRQWANLRLDPSGNPDEFISEYKNIQYKLRTLVPSYPTFPDEICAMDILSRFPHELDSLKSQFLTPNADRRMTAVEEALRNWYRSQTAGRNADRKASARQSERANAAITKEETPCLYFKKNGKCRFGDKCRYSHSSSQTAAASTSKAADRPGSTTAGDDEWTFLLYEEAANASGQALAASDEANLANSGSFTPQPYHAVIDSGATAHFCGDRYLLKDVKSVAPMNVVSVTGHKTVKEVGELKLTPSVTLKKVRHLPNSPLNLVSVAQVTDTDCQVLFTKRACHILKPGTIKQDMVKNSFIFSCKRQGNLYVHNLRPEPAADRGNFQWRDHEPPRSAAAAAGAPVPAPASAVAASVVVGSDAPGGLEDTHDSD